MIKRYNTTSALLALFLFFTVPASLFAQIDNIGELIRAGKADAETITRAYLKPLPSGLGGGINSGWVNTASTHKTLGFDIQIRGSVAFVPNNDQSFDLNDLQLENSEAQNPDNTIAPTLSGKDQDGPVVDFFSEDGDKLGEFELPSGTGYHIVPAPMIQAGVGLVKDTDLIIRLIPEVSQDDVRYSMKGFGLKHRINQWLPGGNLLPVDLSVMAGYTNIKVESDLNLEPTAPPDPNDPLNDYDNQLVSSSVNSFTFKALVGKKLPFISFYGGVGYETSSLNVDVTGDYPVTAEEPTTGLEFTQTLTDPFSYSENGKNKFSLLAGANFKLAIFNLFGEFTLAEYPVVNAGIGFSFR